MPLTTTQRKLKKEVEEIASKVKMDHWDIKDYVPESRTAHLKLMKQHLVRGEVILKYTLIDEILTCIICNYYFRKPKKEVTYKKLWRTKRFRLFNQNLMDETHLLAKLRLASAIKKVPSNINKTIERVNALRNALAHSFFPENRRQYTQKQGVRYQGVDIFSVQGIEIFEDDCELILECLFRRAFGT
jgi:hypothetical protein